MTTETLTERMPWEPEPETNGGPKVQMFLRRETEIEVVDRENPGTDYRIVLCRIGSLDLHIIDWDDGDPGIAAALDPLIAALTTLRDAAALRAAEATT